MSIAQGTVKAFDEGTASGSLFLDDGTEIAFDGPAFHAGGLRLLRSGQRVRFETDAGGRISRLTLLTFA